jgi:predicted ArsR family transcriptional regulator
MTPSRPPVTGAAHNRPQPPDSTRARVAESLRRGPRTLDQLTSELGLTRTAVRLHLATLERDGTVVRRGLQPGRTKPSHVYELTGAAEQALSRAYVPVLTQLLHVLSQRLAPAEFDEVMRDVGRGLVAEQSRPRGRLRDRVDAASALLTQLGGLTEVSEQGDEIIIASHGCPLAATAVDHPETCSAMESLVGEFVGGVVHQHCDRSGRPRCRFHVAESDTGAGTAA